MRIISGSAGGLHLAVPKNTDIRPTQDKVRSAIFSMLGDCVPEAAVLDLFAGTGALGIEALSRGAARAAFVEKERRCLSVLQENLRTCRLAAQATVIPLDAFTYLQRTLPPEQKSAPDAAAPGASALLPQEADGDKSNPELSRASQSLDGSRFDLIFADPPYTKNVPDSEAQAFHGSLLRHIPRYLRPGAFFIYEAFSHRSPCAELLEPWEVLRDRNYGETKVLLLRVKA